MKKFPCKENCGACCKNIENIPELKEFHNGDGICFFLTKDLKCEIYDIRPEVCRTELMYKKKWSFISWDNYIKLSLEMCDFLFKKGK